MTKQKEYKGEYYCEPGPKPILTTIYNPVELGFKIGFGMLLFYVVATITVFFGLIVLGLMMGVTF